MNSCTEQQIMLCLYYKYNENYTSKEAFSMKKMILRILLGVLILVLLLVAGFGVLYAGRIRTVNSIEKVTDYDDYNLYRMDVKYDYSIDDVITTALQIIRV